MAEQSKIHALRSLPGLVPVGIATVAGIGLDLMTNMLTPYWPDAPHWVFAGLFYLGSALTFLPTMAWLTVKSWGTKTFGAVTAIWALLIGVPAGMKLENYFYPVGSNGVTTIQFGPRKRATVPPAPIPTYLHILFGPISIAPKEIQSANIEWQAIELTHSGVTPKYIGPAILSADPTAMDRLRCSMSVDFSDRTCFVPYSYKYLELVLSFDKPITFKNIRVSAAQGGETPKWDQVIMTETDAVLRFDSYPSDLLLNIEAVNEKPK
jgi:hypothetical protein